GGIGRSQRTTSTPDEKKKIALFCNVRPSAVVQAIDSDSIYEVPVDYHREGLDEEIIDAFGIADAPAPDLSRWVDIAERIKRPDGQVTIAVAGKYTGMKDTYKSLTEALAHGGLANNVRVDIKWIDATVFEQEADALAELEGVHGILVPGGFGERGAEGKIRVAQFARERKVPYFGICFGMQMAVIEAVRNLLGEGAANSSEFGETEAPVVGLMTEWTRDGAVETRNSGGDLGGTMRLGAYDAVLAEGSQVAEIYGTRRISERHRHRFEVDISYAEALKAHGMSFSGVSPDGALPEILELAGHPWYVGVQFHPELKSRPFAPHPLFAAFIGAAVEQSRLV
ncbi:MAG: CTP synthase, partial [Pseudomonadota bacterium]